MRGSHEAEPLDLDSQAGAWEPVKRRYAAVKVDRTFSISAIAVICNKISE